MLISVCTPTHRPLYLAETYQSLLAQDWQDWEWVIGLDGVVPEQIQPHITADKRCRLLQLLDDRREGLGIGYLKRRCFQAADGDVLVELDHDDLLTNHALSRIASTVDSGCGFVHSDWAEVKVNGLAASSFTYHTAFGWESYPFHLYGQELLACRAFPVNARSLAEMWFSPNHVRAWTRECYRDVGGHDPYLLVGDDHDLLCRTYLAGYRFGHIPEPLYVYRRHGDNTVDHWQPGIRGQQTVNIEKYLPHLIREDCRRRSRAVCPAGLSHALREVGWVHLGELTVEEASNLSFGQLFDDLPVGCWLSFSATNLALLLGAYAGMFQLVTVIQNHNRTGKTASDTFYFYSLKGQRRVPRMQLGFVAKRRTSDGNGNP